MLNNKKKITLHNVTCDFLLVTDPIFTGKVIILLG